MGLKAAVQALKKAEEIKARVSRHNDLLNNSEVWSDQQQLQTVYQQVLVLDLEYALDKKVEQELWTLGFKNHIGALQHMSKDKKNPKRSEYQALLSWCLEAASGFYLTLLQELCTVFDLDLPFRRRGAIYGQSKASLSNNTSNHNDDDTIISSASAEHNLTQPHKNSCYYICQYCLVHLGDIARYRLQRKQAESFYRQAILLSPWTGQPYNQLALLEASRGDKLATVFHYVRSIAVKHPFPVAATNLSNTLSAVIDHEEPLVEIHSKLSFTEFLSVFLRVHGLLHLASNLNQAELCVKSLNATFTALVATNAFSSLKLVQMTTINLYTLRHATESLSNKELSADELRVKHLILDLLAGAFSAFLLPIYTMPNDATLLNYAALPAIKLTLDWIKINPSVLKEDVFTKRLQIWPSLCKLLNVLQTICNDFDDLKNSEKFPLPEDRDLQCFLPLTSAFKELDFTIVDNSKNNNDNYFSKLRVLRLVNISDWLATQPLDNNILITAKKAEDSKIIYFEPCIKQPDPTTELLEELKYFSIKDQLKSASEKRGGILKPQGSLEKARIEREQQQPQRSLNINPSVTTASVATSTIPNNSLATSTSTGMNTVAISTNNDQMKLKRSSRQNVAMQTIAKKIEENTANNKQVTFLTEPPVKNKIQQQPPPPPPPPLSSAQQTLALLPQPLPLQPKPPVNNKINISCTNNANIINTSNNSFLPIPVSPPVPPPQQQQQQQMPYNNSTYPVNSPPMYPPIQPQQQQQPQSNVMFRPQQFSNMFDIQQQLQLQQQQQQLQHQLHQQQQLLQQQQIYNPANTWLQHDDNNKLPMPPSTWTSWPGYNNRPNQQNPPQIDLFHQQQQQHSFATSTAANSSSSNIGQALIDESIKNQFGNTKYNDIWNSGANFPPNIQMLLDHRQQPQQLIPNQQIPGFPTATTPPIQQQQSNSPVLGGGSGSYSLFNSNNWAPNLHSALNASTMNSTTAPGAANSDRSAAPLLRQQSLFSGPGPSPLERLLQQQKQQRNTNTKEDT